MKTTITAIVAALSFVACANVVGESYCDVEVSRIAGNWVLQSESKGAGADTTDRCDLSIEIDELQGKSLRIQDSNYEPYVTDLRQQGFIPIATGKIHVLWPGDQSNESFLVIARKDGCLHLCYGPFGGVPRIFLGRGSSRAADRLVIEWSADEAFCPSLDADGEHITTIHVRRDAKTLVDKKDQK